MSTNRLNADERASFLIGEALRKAMVNEKHSAALHELFWAAYVRRKQLVRRAGGRWAGY